MSKRSPKRGSTPNSKRARTNGKNDGCEFKVAFIGASGAFCEKAALDYFKTEEKETTGCKSISAVFEAFENGDAKYGVVPVENTESGSFRPVYDGLSKHDLFIVGECVQEMKHCFLALPGVKMKDVRKVYSHPHVFEECAHFLSKLEEDNGHEIEKVAVTDTAGSCALLQTKSAAERKCIAAIASEKAGQIHSLETLKCPIANDRNITTRYIILSKTQAMLPLADAGNLKRSLEVCIGNQPGSIFKMLSCFAFRNINILKLEARPSSKALHQFEKGSRHWEYVHFVDFEPSKDASVNESLMQNLTDFSISVRDFGVYQKKEADNTEESQSYELLFR